MRKTEAASVFLQHLYNNYSIIKALHIKGEKRLFFF